MKYRQGRVLETLHSVQVFLDEHADTLDAINKSGARTTLDEIAAELEAHAVQQDGSFRKAKGETANQRALRLALRFTMRPIATVAKARLQEAPKFVALTLPSYRVRGMALVAAANAMADAATPHADVFVSAGLPADFVAQVRAAAQALSDSHDTRRNGQTARVGATLGLDEAERRARQALQVLDTLVEPALNHDQPLLGNWKSVRRIPRKPGPARETVVRTTPENGAPPPAIAGTVVPLLPAPSDTAPVEDAEDEDPGDKQAA